MKRNSVDRLKKKNFGSKNIEKSKIDFVISTKLSYHFYNATKDKKKKLKLVNFVYFIKRTYFFFLGQCGHRIAINIWA